MRKATGNRTLIHAHSPPAKPLMLYDGDCKFCTLWIHRWQLATGDRVEYLPFQDPHGADKYPEIPRERFDAAVQLIMPDGTVYGAAEAVCRSLASDPQAQWLLELYRHSPVFVWISETAYGFVARHRKIFSLITRLLWGRHLEPPQHNLVRGIFLRCLGIIYLSAFLSLWTQIPALIGSHGSSPAAMTMAAAKQNFDAQGIGVNRYHLLPTLCWFNAGDGFLNLQCAAGTALAVLIILGVAPVPGLFLLWLIYLSLTTLCGALPGFGWSNLLLETGFLAIFFAPLQLRPRHPFVEPPPSRVALWLLRWLLFRLAFASGSFKFFRDHDLWLKPVFDALAFGVDYLLPCAIFLPRLPRQFACVSLIVLQILILPGSHCVLFNFLVLALCLTLLDDATVETWLPKNWPSRRPNPIARQLRWPTAIELTVVILVGCAGYSQFFKFIGLHMPGPEPIVAANHWLAPLRTFNSYSRPP